VILRMKILLTILCLLPGPVVLAAADDFTSTMTADERAATGLEKLSPEELARLKAVVERYKQGAAADARLQAGTAAAAEAKAGPEAQPAPGEQKKPGWLHALITLEKSAAHPTKEMDLESRIAGNFKGWSGRTTFRLENGQVWQQVNPDVYQASPVLSPRVKIYPAMVGGFWLEVDGMRVKVKPIKLQ
jgi:hypothetical protein